MGEILKKSHNLLEAIPYAFLFTDVHSKILYANRQAESFFGYGPEEMEGQRMRILFWEEDMIYFLPNIVYLTRYKNGFNGEALLKRKDGQKIFVHLLTTSFREEGDVFLSFAFQEIQRLKKLEREMRDVERWSSLGRMVGEIAHQFRNPIAAIGGYTNRLLKNLGAPPKGRSYGTQILQEVGRLETILQRVEDYVQIPPPAFRRERIQEIVAAAMPVLAKRAKDHGVSILLDTSGLAGDGQLFIDRKLMIQVLAQVLENSLEAIKLNPDGKRRGAMELSLFDDGENVGVAVTDRGQGIAKKNLNRIFDPFFTTHPERVGLGLNFIWRVMEEHSGRVRVESQWRKGTTITLNFPKDRRRKVRREFISPEVLESSSL